MKSSRGKHIVIGRVAVVIALLFCGGCDTCTKHQERKKCNAIKVQPQPATTEQIPVEKPETLALDRELDLCDLLNLAFEHNPTTKIAWRQAMQASAKKNDGRQCILSAHNDRGK